MRIVGFEPGVYILLAVLLFIVPLKWIIAWIVAICFHEMAHIITVKAFGGNIRRIKMRLSGANLEAEQLSKGKYLISLLAGPLGGLIPVLFSRYFPRIAICSWLLSAYNLLPILPLDGGQIVRVCIKNDKTFSVVQTIMLGILLLTGCYLFVFTNFSLLPILCIVSIWIKNRKIPCKERLLRVQ